LCAGRFDKIYNTIVKGKIDVEQLKHCCTHEGADFFERIAHNSEQRLQYIDDPLELPAMRLSVLEFVMDHSLVPAVSVRAFLKTVLRELASTERMWGPEQNKVTNLLQRAFVDRTLKMGPINDSDWIFAYQQMIFKGLEAPLKWFLTNGFFDTFLEPITPLTLYNAIAGCAQGEHTVRLNVLLTHLISAKTDEQPLNFLSSNIAGDCITFEHTVLRFPEKIQAWTDEQRNNIPSIVVGVIQNHFANNLVPILLNYSNANVGNEAFVECLNSLNLRQYSLNNTTTFLNIIKHRPHLLSIETHYMWQGKNLTVYDLCFHKSSIAHFYNEDDKAHFHNSVNEVNNERQNAMLHDHLKNHPTVHKRAKL
jgi:hypothetical protein